MSWVNLIVLACLASCLSSASVSNRKFPENFKFSIATAAFQVEGGWNADGKGETIWDRLDHTRKDFIANGSSADEACDSYHRYKDDVLLLKDLGLKYYRFSLSWSRLLPSGFINKVNQAGVKYYKNLISLLKQNGIEPMVTLYHYDLPQPLQDIGGWPNEQLIDHYVNYATFAFKLFGDDVKYWFTFNEAAQICNLGYGSSFMAPAITSSGIGDYLCAHNVIRAHARAYHVYQDQLKAKQKGKVSVVLHSFWIEPNTNSTSDIEAAERMLQFSYGWYANPIVNGNYPQVMIDRIRNRSLAEGFLKSRLPEFTPEESKYIKGTYDFVSLNHYTSMMAEHLNDTPIGDPSWVADVGVNTFYKSSWPGAASFWLKSVPWGVRKILNWLKNFYNDPEIIITENGFSDRGTLDDTDRITYLQEYLSNILDAIHIDKVNVTGYTAWSLMDNFEWRRGYTEKFGIVHVDFNSPNRTRTPKQSYKFYKNLISTGCLADKCDT